MFLLLMWPLSITIAVSSALDMIRQSMEPKCGGGTSNRLLVPLPGKGSLRLGDDGIIRRRTVLNGLLNRRISFLNGVKNRRRHFPARHSD